MNQKNEYEIPIGSLEEQALKRKERLKNLKRKTQAADAGWLTNASSNEKGKSALPLPAALAESTAKTTTTTDADVEMPDIQLKNDDVISKITTEVDTLKTPIIIEDIDIQNLAPRKPDWDLKRDVSKKLEILERRTQRAIAELIRDRLQLNRDNVDLQAVNAVGYTAKPTET